MRSVLALCLFAPACIADPPANPPSTWSPGGSDVGSGSAAPACAPDSVPSVGAVGISGGTWVFTHEPVQLGASWTQACSGLVACPWDDDDPPEYASCETPAFTASATASGAGEQMVDEGTRYGSHTWSVTPSTTGTLALHVETANPATGEQHAEDTTVEVRDLEDIRFRCFVGPALFGPSPTPCPTVVPAGTEIGVAIDGVMGGDEYFIAPELTWTGLGTTLVGCVGEPVAGDTHYSDNCITDSGLTQTVTVTATAYGVTRSYTIAVQ